MLIYRSDGDTFDIYCGEFVFGDEITEVDDTLPDFPSCMALCANTPGCVGVDWADSLDGAGGITGCAILGNVSTTSVPVYNFAVMSNYTLPAGLLPFGCEGDC